MFATSGRHCGMAGIVKNIAYINDYNKKHEFDLSIYGCYTLIKPIHVFRDIFLAILPRCAYNYNRRKKILKITWYGHACFKLETGEGSAIFDPYTPGSVPGLTLPEELFADAVFCSHLHKDHGYARAVHLSGSEPGFRVERLHSFHDSQQGAVRGENLITVIEAEGKRIAHLGDLGHMPDSELLGKLKGLSVIMIPIGGYYTIDSKIATELVDILQPRITIPMHYRSDGFGHAVLSTADQFVAACAHIKKYKTNELYFTGNEEKFTALLCCPADLD